MIDPVSAFAIATSAYKALERGVGAARSLESMGKDLSRWMSAVSDIDRAHHEAKNPPLFKKLFAGASVEKEALDLFIQKKQLEEQRDNLRRLIGSMLGPQAWQELIRMEKDIRQQRKETLYKQREMRKHFIEAIAATFLGVIVIAFLTFIIVLTNQ
jgi:hypothetical protein